MSKQVYCNVATSLDTTYLLMQKRHSDALWSEFGAWIREHRERNHLSQSGAAQRAGIDRQQWYRIESGKSGTRRDTVIEIAKALSLDVNEALNRAGFSPAGSESELLDIGIDARVKLADKNLTPEEQKEIAEELAFAYEIIMRRRAERAEKER